VLGAITMARRQDGSQCSAEAAGRRRWYTAVRRVNRSQGLSTRHLGAPRPVPQMVKHLLCSQAFQALRDARPPRRLCPACFVMRYDRCAHSIRSAICLTAAVKFGKGQFLP
jgi:hypothetical protein